MDLKEFRTSKEIINKLKLSIYQKVNKPLTIMEVCGTHTMSIFRYGIQDILPKEIKLISGPGCPVCVTQNEIIDKLLVLAEDKNNIITTFGDMLRVPGTKSTLYNLRANGANVKIVYSPLISLDIAKKNPDKKVIFMAVGFETTIPAIALTIKEAKKRNIKNFYILCAHKTIPLALEALATMENKVDSFLLPGHVSSIIGAKAYEFLPEKFGIPGVIAGFEPVDILNAIRHIIEMESVNEKKILNAYKRIVSYKGNVLAQNVIKEVFTPCDSYWRGIGNIPDTGLRLNEDYIDFDIENKVNIDVSFSKEPAGCICGEVLCGIKTPLECKLFDKVCSPENPIGACMVSFEGTCSAYYKYGRRKL